MGTVHMLVEHYMTLIRNIAYLAANGVDYVERMNALIARAVEHLCCARVADELACKRLLRGAIERELCHVHIQHPQYAQSLLLAMHSLD